MIEATPKAAKFPGSMPPPPGVQPNINFDPSTWNIVTNVLCMISITVFITLRVLTKYLASLKFHIDDWVSLGAWAGCTLWCSLSLAAGPQGLGTHMWNVTPLKLQKMFEIGYVIEVIYGPVIFLTKLAILLLLMRIFHIKKRFVLAVKVFIWASALYYIAITLVKIFICTPVQKFWNHKLAGKCLNTNTIFISDCVIALLTDLMVLCTPMPVIWGLQVDTKKKLGITFSLVVGAVACVFSILRLEASIRTMNSNDKSYVFEAIVLYGSGEMAIGIICGCIPVLPALYRHFHRSVHTRYQLSKTGTYATEKSGMSQDSHRGMVPLENMPSLESVQEAHIRNKEDAGDFA